MGKTAFSLSIAKKAAAKYHVLYFSLEMNKEKIADRLLIGVSGVDADRYYEGELTDEELTEVENAKYTLSSLKLNIYDNSAMTVEQITAVCKAKRIQGECDLVIIDYLGLIKPSSKNASYNKVQETGEISHKLKALAKDVSVPVICLSQLNRGCEQRSDKKPHLADLRDSGDIEQDADIAMFLFRPAKYPETYKINDENRNVAELSIEKHRNGRTGIVKFRHNDSMTEFYDETLTKDENYMSERTMQQLKTPF